MGAARKQEAEMTKYLISFREGAMDFRDEEELAEVAEAGSAMTREAMEAGVWVFGGGLKGDHEDASVVGADGVVTDGPYPESKEHIGGFIVVDVASREEALEWAAKCAAACRCAQEVREFLPEPTEDDPIPEGVIENFRERRS